MALEGAKPGALMRISPVSAERLTQSAPDCWAEAKGMVCAKAHAERSEMAGLNFINLMIDSGRVNSGRVNRMGVNLEGEANLLGSLGSFEYTQMLRLGYHPKRGYFTFIVASLLLHCGCWLKRFFRVGA